MHSILRFRTDDPTFPAQAEAVVAWWSGRPGCLSLEVVRSLDDPGLWAIVGRWADVGSYRRSLGGTEAKLIVTPLLVTCIDEPNTFLPPSELDGTLHEPN